jgi:choline dehydrogenase-like flavoprotein
MSKFHPHVTCAMGPRDRGGVIDARLVVLAVENLRVADASVLPPRLRGNVLSSVYAVSDRVAGIIIVHTRKKGMWIVKRFGGDGFRIVMSLTWDGCRRWNATNC